MTVDLELIRRTAQRPYYGSIAVKQNVFVSFSQLFCMYGPLAPSSVWRCRAARHHWAQTIPHTEVSAVTKATGALNHHHHHLNFTQLRFSSYKIQIHQNRIRKGLSLLVIPVPCLSHGVALELLDQFVSEMDIWFCTFHGDEYGVGSLFKHSLDQENDFLLLFQVSGSS